MPSLPEAVMKASWSSVFYFAVDALRSLVELFNQSLVYFP
jgi:hypothetical protein